MDESDLQPGAETAVEARQLKDQAETFRDLIRENEGSFSQGSPSAARSLLTVVMVLVVLGAVVALLIDGGGRRRLLERAAGSWVESYASGENKMVRLPPPASPPREPADFPRVGSPATPAADEPQGVLFLDIQPGGRAEPAADEPPRPPEKNDANEEAYQLLLERSESAAGLVGGELADYRFLSWAPVREEPPVYWIDLTATASPGEREVHLIWSVDKDSGRVAPLSQAARDLERR